MALLTGLALAGAGLVVYAVQSARVTQNAVEQVDQELAEFGELQRIGRDPETGREFTSVRRLIGVFLERNVPSSSEVLVGFWDGAARTKSISVRDDRAVDQLLGSDDFVSAVKSHLATGGSEEIATPWGDVLVSAQPVSDPSTQGAFVVAYFLDDDHARLNELMRTYAVVAAAALVVITGLAAAQAGRLLRPVRTLRETAQELSDSDLSRRIPETGNDDITALTRTVNDMLDRLEAAFEGQREFLDDAGHELRTPLTVLRGHLELMSADDPFEVERTRALLLDEIDRMSSLVGDLITLAKSQRPDFLTFGRVDVAELTSRVANKCLALGDREWRVEERAKVETELDERRITQALLQLAHNAVKHTVPGDSVALGSRLNGDGLLHFWVRDTGTGVPDRLKAEIFDRFVRGPGSGDEGAGLGLSIVSAIATGHGGTVSVEDVAPRGARFVMSLPVRLGEPTWHAS